MPVFLDIETYSDEPIKNGTFRYSESAELLMCAWAVDTGPVSLWDTFNEPDIPEELENILLGDDILIAHNSIFESSVLAKTLQGVTIDPKRWRCTMAQAYAHGLPGALDNLGIVLGLPQDKKKSKDGYDLIRLFCMPPAKNSKRGRATHLTHPKEWERFKSYCIQDVVAHREVYKRLPTWNYKDFELNLWHLDQKINARGVCIDVELAQAAVKTVDRAQLALKERTQDITYGDVQSATQRDEMLRHILEAYGVELPDMQASTLERRIDDPDLPENLRELLAIRLMATTSSTAKYNKVLKCISKDGRLRGTLQFCGASRTGRWSGRLFQPQNLARATLEPNEIERGIKALKADCADLMYDNVMEVASNAVRGVITASPGKKLVVSDLANIEGRYAAWISGEEWKLQAFRDYDTITGHDKDGKPIRKGHDLYKLDYANAFRVKPEDVTKKQRDEIGKTMSLALGFAGGVGAFVTFATAFNVDLNDLADRAWDLIPQDILAEAKSFWDYCVKEKKTLGLKARIFITCDSLKRMWRLANPQISSHWKELEDAVREAIVCPGTEVAARKVKAYRKGNWLRILMPSGRCLCYPHPRVDNHGQISFMGTDQYTRKWQRIGTFGGRLFENIVQAGARDVMAANMLRIEEEGFQILLTVHDEIITEVPIDAKGDLFNLDKLSHLLFQVPSWAEGLPLAADGFESYRYRK